MYDSVSIRGQEPNVDSELCSPNPYHNNRALDLPPVPIDVNFIPPRKILA